MVHVLHPDFKYAALENPPQIDLERIAAEKEINELVEEFGPQQKIDATLVRHGPVAEQVVAVIEEKSIDLLVIGTRGRGGLQKLALGSVAEELLRVAPCPVMTIGPKADIASATHGTGISSNSLRHRFWQGIGPRHCRSHWPWLERSRRN